MADEAEKAAQNCPSVEVKIMVGENRLGWHDFDKEVEAFPDTYERKPDAPCGSDPMLMFFTSGTTATPKSPSTTTSTPWATTSPPSIGTM